MTKSMDFAAVRVIESGLNNLAAIEQEKITDSHVTHHRTIV